MNNILNLVVFVCVWSASLTNGFSPTDKLRGQSVHKLHIEDYRDRIRPFCFDTNNAKIYPIGNSIETLISLIEKLENQNDVNGVPDTTYKNDAKSITTLLLRRFHLDGLDNNDKPKPRENTIDNIRDRMLGLSTESVVFPENKLTEDEKCALFHMLSHRYEDMYNNEPINKRTRTRTKRQAWYHKQNAPVQSEYLPNQNRLGVQTGDNNRNRQIGTGEPVPIQYTQEDGVVSLKGNKQQAIAAGRLLVGILVALSGLPETVNVKTIAESFRPGFESTETSLDVLWANTLADLYGLGSTTDGNTNAWDYGAKGKWLTQCPGIYYLINKDTTFNLTQEKYEIKATEAEIRAGIDAYQIGKILKDKNIQSNDPNIRLSSILRQYYSPQGLLSVSYCNRVLTVSTLETHARTYGLLWQYVESGGYTALPNNRFPVAFEDARRSDSSDILCRPNTGGLPCETPQDVIFVIDPKNEALNRTLDFVDMIGSNLADIRRDGGAISVFLANTGSVSPRPNIAPTGYKLAPLAFNTTSSACATCGAADLNNLLSARSLTDLGLYYEGVNDTLMGLKYWTPRANSSGIPGKTVVMIDQGSLQAPPTSGGDRDRYNKYKDALRYRHKDVLYITINQNKDIFNDLVRDNQKQQYDVSRDPSSSVNEIVKNICENSAIFQHRYCDHHASNEQESLYTGYITPMYQQRWAMYPEFFLKSFNIRFIFKAEDGDIKVCYGRHPNPVDRCLNKIESGKEDYFEISDPCKDKSFESCDPFYFTIEGLQSSGNKGCTDERCKGWNQIKYTVRHRGVQCSWAETKIASIQLLIIACLISSLFYYFK